MIDALRIIVGKSPTAAKEAMQCMRAVAVKSPVVQHRYNRVVEMAFSDPEAKFTAEERELIASCTGDDGGDAKLLDVRVRVNAEEKIIVQHMAAEAGMNVSEFIRDRIGL